MSLLRHGLYAPKRLRKLAQYDQELAVVAIFENAVDDVKSKSWIVGIKLGHGFIMEFTFHLRLLIAIRSSKTLLVQYRVAVCVCRPRIAAVRHVLPTGRRTPVTLVRHRLAVPTRRCDRPCVRRSCRVRCGQYGE